MSIQGTYVICIFNTSILLSSRLARKRSLLLMLLMLLLLWWPGFSSLLFTSYRSRLNTGFSNAMLPLLPLLPPLLGMAPVISTQGKEAAFITDHISIFIKIEPNQNQSSSLPRSLNPFLYLIHHLLPILPSTVIPHILHVLLSNSPSVPHSPILLPSCSPFFYLIPHLLSVLLSNSSSFLHYPI